MSKIRQTFRPLYEHKFRHARTAFLSIGIATIATVILALAAAVAALPH